MPPPEKADGDESALRARVDALLERVRAAERLAAERNTEAEAASAAAEAHRTDRAHRPPSRTRALAIDGRRTTCCNALARGLTRAHHGVAAFVGAHALAQVRDLQTSCRELQHVNKGLEEEGQRIAASAAERREEIQGKVDAAIESMRSSAGAEEKERERIAAENIKTAERLRALEAQRDATERHREAEARSKGLEERLACARLAEADGRLAEALARNRVAAEQERMLAAREASQREQVQPQAPLSLPRPFSSAPFPGRKPHSPRLARLLPSSSSLASPPRSALPSLAASLPPAPAAPLPAPLPSPH